MKKITALLLICALAGCLCACSRGGQDAPKATQEPTEELTASATDAATAAQTHVPPASDTNTAGAQEGGVESSAKFQAAKGCIGMDVSELYTAAGQPNESQYGPSCLEENAEDGMLFYDGFYVWTVRSAEGEVVHDVCPNEADASAEPAVSSEPVVSSEPAA